MLNVRSLHWYAWYKLEPITSTSDKERLGLLRLSFLSHLLTRLSVNFETLFLALFLTLCVSARLSVCFRASRWCDIARRSCLVAFGVATTALLLILTMSSQGPGLPSELSSWKHEQSLLRVVSPYHQDDIAKYLEQGVKEQGHDQQEKALQRDIHLLAHAQAQKFRQIRNAQKFRHQVGSSGACSQFIVK